jgi:hypothetical protein
MPRVFKATSYVAPLKAGLYDAFLQAIEEADSSYGSGQYLKWHFTIEVQGRDPVDLTVFSSEKFTPGAKARKMAEALLNRTIMNGEELEYSALMGKLCRVLVRVDTFDDGSTRNAIDQVLPPESSEDVPF